MNPEDMSAFVDILPPDLVERSSQGGFQLDIERLPNKVLRQIESYVKSKLPPRKISNIRQKRQKKLAKDAQEKQKSQKVE